MVLEGEVRWHSIRASLASSVRDGGVELLDTFPGFEPH